MTPSAGSGVTRHFSPGRIEVLGKHTDYAGGNVLVCAVDRGVTATIAPAQAGIVASTTALPGDVDLTPGSSPELPAGHWGRYLQTVVNRLAANFGELSPCRIEVDSNLPLASGMSSSSALVVATAMALAHHNGFDRTELWTSNITTDVQLASYLACIENGKTFGGLTGHGGVGTLGGSEDHTAMLCSRPGQLGQFSFNPPSLVRRVALPADHCLVVLVSGVAAEKTGAALGGYNQASLDASECLRRWNAAGHEHPNLAAALASEPTAADQLAALVADDARLTARLHQFVMESTQIIPAAVDALCRGDLRCFGAQVARSQSLAADGLHNQVPQTEALVRLALAQGAVAASSFGAGFGGSVWALAPVTEADEFARRWLEVYAEEFPDEAARATTLVTRPSGPACDLSEEMEGEGG
ncbi:galactokinase family protein [Luteococcus sp. H138]|uniref:GHMP family kinase ATP-binding protein n=1 Tax=unclassified Luteococcus TaxID=2639923 RepID=UPI00313CE0F7